MRGRNRRATSTTTARAMPTMAKVMLITITMMISLLIILLRVIIRATDNNTKSVQTDDLRVTVGRFQGQSGSLQTLLRTGL